MAGNSFFAQYPATISAIICSGSPYKIDLGTVTSTNGTQQLERAGIQIFKRGLQPTVTMKLNAYRSSTLIATSESIAVSAIEAAYADTSNFYGWVRFTFSPRLNLITSTATRFELELTNYSFDENATWIGAIRDWPITMGYQSSPDQIQAAVIAMELYGQAAIR